MIILTERGKKEIEYYIKNLKAKRKEILDANKDTSDDTELPSVEDIISDIEYFGDEDGYCNSWGVTDNSNADNPLSLIKNVDYIINN